MKAIGEETWHCQHRRRIKSVVAFDSLKEKESNAVSQSVSAFENRRLSPIWGACVQAPLGGPPPCLCFDLEMKAWAGCEGERDESNRTH